MEEGHDVDALNKGAGKRKSKGRGKRAKAKAKASRAMPKTAIGKRAGRKKVTNILMDGLGKVTNKLMGGGKRQIGRQILGSGWWTTANDCTPWESEEAVGQIEINSKEKLS